jgi:hypothetical protein
VRNSFILRLVKGVVILNLERANSYANFPQRKIPTVNKHYTPVPRWGRQREEMRVNWPLATCCLKCRAPAFVRAAEGDENTNLFFQHTLDVVYFCAEWARGMQSVPLDRLNEVCLCKNYCVHTSRPHLAFNAAAALRALPARFFHYAIVNCGRAIFLSLYIYSSCAALERLRAFIVSRDFLCCMRV